MVFTGPLFNLFMLCLQDLYLTFSCGVCRTSIELLHVVFVGPLFNLFIWFLQDLYSACSCSVCRTSIQLVHVVFAGSLFNLFMWWLQNLYLICSCEVSRTSIQLADFIWPIVFSSFCVPYRQSWRFHWLSKPCYQYEHRACRLLIRVVDLN